MRVLAWLAGFVLATAICYLPASWVLFVVAMSLGFSPGAGAPAKWSILVITLAAVAGLVFLLARAIKKRLMAE